MEFLLIISLICQNSPDKAQCESKYTECVNWVYEQPETKAKNLHKFDVAVWLKTNKKLAEVVCK